MLKELGLGDDNKILFMHFRILGMSLDDELVPLEANADVIKLLNYVPMCKETEVYIETDLLLLKQHLVELLVSHSQSKGVGHGVVIDKIVEDNVVSSIEKESRLLMLEWHGIGKEEVVSSNGKESRLLMLDWLEMGKEEEHVDPSTHASTLIFDEWLNLGMMRIVVDLQYDAYNFVDEQQEIVEIVVELNHLDEEECFYKTGAQVDHRHDIDEEVIEMEENMVEEEEGFVGGDESDLQKDENEIPHPEQEMDIQNFYFQVHANLEQSRMEADKIWKEFGADVIDFDHFHSGDEGDDEHSSQT
ncbi:hypothetical protein Tco_0965188 [Tanacetum coccineum]